MFDAHNHLQRFPDPDAIIAMMKSVGIVGCVVNGTSEADWTQVAELATNHPDFVQPAFGLHPWFVHHRSNHWFDKLQQLMDRFPHASIGECGVDGWIDRPKINEQIEVFLPQIRLARERNLPLTIHALKAWQPLIDSLRQEAPPAKGFLLHSFGGSLELMKRFLQMGAFFSISGHFLHPRKSKLLGVFRQIPSARLLLETDAPDMLPPKELTIHPLPDSANHPANLPAITAAFAKHLNQDYSELANTSFANAKRFFATDPIRH